MGVYFLATAAIGGLFAVYLFLKAPRHPDIRSHRRRWIIALQISTVVLFAIVCAQLAWPRTPVPQVRLLVILDLGAWLVMVLGTYRRLAIYRFKAPREVHEREA